MIYDIVERSPKSRYYRFDHIIGTGAYKQVSQAYDVEKGIYVAWNAIKLNKLNDTQKAKIRDEIKILVDIKDKHANVLNIHSSWFKKEENTVVFITDLFMSGSLHHFIQNVKQIKIKVLKKWCAQLLDGISFLHSKNIIHRDIKCNNIFINGTTGNIVIGDFGIARVVSSEGNASSILGTPEYMAPEIYDEKYSKETDIYSFGMCVLEMVAQEVPYSECSNFAQIWKKVVGQNPPDVLSKIDNPILREMIEKCIAFKKEDRPTIEQILEFPLFKSTEYDETWVSEPPPILDEKTIKTVEDEIEDALNDKESHLEETHIEKNSDDEHSGGSTTEIPLDFDEVVKTVNAPKNIKTKTETETKTETKKKKKIK
jgi:WNK lysine deficient protein kinase